MENTKPMSCCSKETVQKKQETPIDSDCMFSCDCSLSVATVEQKNYVSITEIHLEAPKLLIVFEQVFESDSSIELIVFENPPDKFGSQTPIYKKNAVFLI